MLVKDNEITKDGRTNELCNENKNRNIGRQLEDRMSLKSYNCCAQIRIIEVKKH